MRMFTGRRNKNVGIFFADRCLKKNFCQDSDEAKPPPNSEVVEIIRFIFTLGSFDFGLSIWNS